SRAGEIILREVRPVDGRSVVVAEHHNAPAILRTPEHFRSGKARRASSDDDDPLRRRPAGLFAGRRRRALVSDEDLAAALLHRPAVEGAEGGRPQGLAGPDIETGVMPRTPNGAAGPDAFGERPVIVGAVGADRKDVGPFANE